MTAFVKDPAEALDYAIDFSGKLAGDTLVSATWAIAPAGSLTIDPSRPPTVIGPLAVILLIGGIDGVTYTLVATGQTSTGNTIIGREELDCRLGGGRYDLVVDVAQIRNYMSGIRLTEPQLHAAAGILAGVQRELERYMNRPLVRKERTETIRPDTDGRLWPTATPVTSVSTVGYAAAGNEIVGNVGLGTGLSGPQAVTVTYVGGIDGRNEHDVVLAIERIAAREITTRHDDTMSIKDLSARNEGEPVQRVPLGLTDDEAKKLDRLRRRTIVS